MSGSFFQITVREDQILSAGPDSVFTTLLQWNAYAEWNPYITRIEGKALAGQMIQVFFFMGLGPRMPLRCQVREVNTAKRILAWEYKAFLPWLYTAEHSFVVEELQPGQCRLVQMEKIQGFIASRLFGFFHRLLQKRFQAMHAALRERLTRSAA
jgi:hypothetical protein